MARLRYALGACDHGYCLDRQLVLFHRAPKNILLEIPVDIARAARVVYVHAGVTNAMPPANVSFIEEKERGKIIRWYNNATRDASFYVSLR